MKRLASGLAATILVLAMAVASPAIAATTPPTATTGVASMISSSSAVASATVNPNGTTTTYAFQYGPTTNYGLQTTTTAAGAGTSSTTVHATISGLISNTPYHFRVIATSANGTTAGTDATFTTSKTPPTATTGQPSFVKDTSAVVNATVNPNGKSTTYTFQYGPTTSYGLQTTTTAAGAGTTNTTVHATFSGLVAGTTYHYRVSATSSDGTTVGADVTFLTTGTRVAPTGPLPVVSEATAVSISPHGVQLNGAINPEGPSTTWYFEIGLTTSYGLQTTTQTISGLGARGVSVRLTGLQSGSTYHFRLVAYSANGLYVGPDHTFNTKQGARTRPGGLVVNASSRRSSSRLTITISGDLQLPATITKSAGCNGTVAIEVRRGNATIGLRRASVRSDCSYSLHIYIAISRLHGSTKLGIFGLFSGNALLLPASSQRTLHI
jgi:hypothetical protein